MSTTFNANKKEEQDRLRRQFSGEKDIVVCRAKDACYVKGNLMPTRALGDFRLKKAEFNFHNFNRELGYRAPIEKYNGPYITHVPEVQTVELTGADEYLILASDGLWDEVGRTEAVQLLEGHLGSQEQVAERLFRAAIENISKEKGYSKDFILKMPPGREKRNVVDDITILILNLADQAA